MRLRNAQPTVPKQAGAAEGTHFFNDPCGSYVTKVILVHQYSPDVPKLHASAFISYQIYQPRTKVRSFIPTQHLYIWQLGIWIDDKLRGIMLGG